MRFPKVAFGHWPPAYYTIQAAWCFVFGPHIWSAALLSAVTALTLTALLFFRLRTHHGNAIALGCSAALLVLPEMQTAAWSVMSDLLTGLFVFLAIFAFSYFLQQPRSRSAAIRFTAWSVLAILTKAIASATLRTSSGRSGSSGTERCAARNSSTPSCIATAAGAGGSINGCSIERSVRHLFGLRLVNRLHPGTERTRA